MAIFNGYKDIFSDFVDSLDLKYNFIITKSDNCRVTRDFDT